MKNKEYYQGAENQEKRELSPEERSKLGAKVMAAHESINTPFHALSDRTAQAIINAPDLDERDVKAAKEEADIRKKEGHFDPDANDVDIKKDLDDNYFGFSDGRILIPTEKYVDYRNAVKNGEHGDVRAVRGQVRETVEEYNRRMNEASRERAERMRDLAFREEVREYFADEEHLASIKKGLGLSDNGYSRMQIERFKKEVDALRQNVEHSSHHSRYSDAYSARKAYEYALCKSFRDDDLSIANNRKAIEEGYLALLVGDGYLPGTDRLFCSDEKRMELRRKCFLDIARNSQNIDINYDAVSKKVPKKDRAGIIGRSVRNAIRNGSFCNKLIKENPDAVKSFLDNEGVGKHDEGIEEALIEEMSSPYPSDAEYVEACEKIFDISGSIADVFMNSKSVDQHYYVPLESCARSDGGIDIKAIEGTPGFVERAVDILNRHAIEDAEKIQNDESFGEKVEKAKELAVSKYFDSIDNSIKNADKVLDIESYLSAKNLEGKRYYRDVDLTIGRGHSGKYGQLIIGKLPSMETEVNVAPFIREKLLERLARGAHDGKKDWDHASVEFIGADNFRDIAKEVNLSFADEDNYNAVLEGFFSTLNERNGEKSPSAAAYYTGIFSDDPERFIAKLNEYRESDDCSRGMKAKITRFLSENGEYQAYVLRKKQAKELGLEKSELDNPAILEATSYEDVQKFIDERKEALLIELLDKSEEANTTFSRETRNSLNTGEGGSTYRSRDVAIDFGIEKIEKLNGRSKYIELNIDPDTRHFMRRFYDSADKLSAYNDPNTYHAITFNYGGHLCAMAESFSNDSSAMFVARADEGMEPEELVSRMFEGSKSDARERSDIGVERYYHYEEDLDDLYQKAFAYLKSGRRASNVKEAQKYGHRLLGDMSEMGQINEGELPPQYPFI